MSINNVKSCLALALIIVFAGWPVFSFAEISIGASLSSDNFRVLDPQHSLFGGTASSSSSNFLLTATIGDLAIGSASATTFGWRSGFLYYPKVTAPTLNTATAGNGLELTRRRVLTPIDPCVANPDLCKPPAPKETPIETALPPPELAKTDPTQPLLDPNATTGGTEGNFGDTGTTGGTSGDQPSTETKTEEGTTTSAAKDEGSKDEKKDEKDEKDKKDKKSDETKDEKKDEKPAQKKVAQCT